MKQYVVYRHVSPSGKVYIGISSNVKNRWAGNGYYYCCNQDTVFSRALHKYGWDNFTHEILLEGLYKNVACALEKVFILYYKSKGLSYNITDGGEGTSCKQTEEHIQKRIHSKILHNPVDYIVLDKDFNYTVYTTITAAAISLGGTQANISHVLDQPVGYTFRGHYILKHKKGTPINIESIKADIQKALMQRKEKMSAHTKSLSSVLVNASLLERENIDLETRKERYASYGMQGKKHSGASKEKMAKQAKGRDMTKAVQASAVANSISVQQLLNGEVINVYKNIREASAMSGANASNISQCLKGKRLSAGGYNWKIN